MSVYKVPQDVEADDKLIGPFSFRQFAYLIIVALAILIAYGLGSLLLPLALIPLPIILLFSALALPLRKDQPMETYLAAMVSFLLKPHRRLWDPDGIDSTIEITAPKTIEYQLTKDISQSEAESRIGYLAKIVDSQGWAIRGTGNQEPNNSMITDAYYSAQQVDDIMDVNNAIFKSLSDKLNISDTKRHQSAIGIMKGVAPNIQQDTLITEQKTQTASTEANSIQTDYFGNPLQQPQVSTSDTELAQKIDYDPYPEEMHQKIIKPIQEQKTIQTNTIGKVVSPAKPKTSTSEKPLSADIINLATNTDLSIETIAREASRIHKKEDLNNEVFVSLR